MPAEHYLELVWWTAKFSAASSVAAAMYALATLFRLDLTNGGLGPVWVFLLSPLLLIDAIIVLVLGYSIRIRHHRAAIYLVVYFALTRWLFFQTHNLAATLGLGPGTWLRVAVMTTMVMIAAIFLVALPATRQMVKKKWVDS